jgi:hypothetical protein
MARRRASYSVRLLDVDHAVRDGRISADEFHLWAVFMPARRAITTSALTRSV